MKNIWLMAAVLAACAAPASATVERNDADAFVVVHAIDSAIDEHLLWQRMITPSLWWDSGHTWSGDAANMTLEPRAGGCWCEATQQGGSIEHGHVVAFEPARGRVLMRAELGPLQSMAVNGWLEWRITPRDGGGSHVTWRYTVVGRSFDPDSGLAAGVDMVLAQQLGRLIAVD
ncbi:MAG: SRPBCC family protein [Sphingopyxis sp.]